ncbi:hypothetical protein QJQ45_011213 [Haematococcus lacustris]|nr:hypothetical protein QJQ45_011213 [Haematococcus lacustris]
MVCGDLRRALLSLWPVPRSLHHGCGLVLQLCMTLQTRSDWWQLQALTLSNLGRPSLVSQPQQTSTDVYMSSGKPASALMADRASMGQGQDHVQLAASPAPLSLPALQPLTRLTSLVTLAVFDLDLPWLLLAASCPALRSLRVWGQLQVLSVDAQTWTTRWQQLQQTSPSLAERPPFPVLWELYLRNASSPLCDGAARAILGQVRDLNVNGQSPHSGLVTVSGLEAIAVCAPLLQYLHVTDLHLGHSSRAAGLGCSTPSDDGPGQGTGVGLAAAFASAPPAGPGPCPSSLEEPHWPKDVLGGLLEDGCLTSARRWDARRLSLFADTLALNMQRIGESKWRLPKLCWWPELPEPPANGKEYPELGYKAAARQRTQGPAAAAAAAN